jgi:predicted nucleic acid-binding protein
MAPPFLDTNILLRHLLQDHPQQSPHATAYLERIEQGEIQVRTADTVIFEIVFTLQRRYGQSKVTIQQAVLPLLELPGILLPGKRRFRRVFDLYVKLNISFADAYHAVLMQQEGLEEIIAFDREFDRIPHLRRTEP